MLTNDLIREIGNNLKEFLEQLNNTLKETKRVLNERLDWEKGTDNSIRLLDSKLTKIEQSLGQLENWPEAIVHVRDEVDKFIAGYRNYQESIANSFAQVNKELVGHTTQWQECKRRLAHHGDAIDRNARAIAITIDRLEPSKFEQILKYLDKENKTLARNLDWLETIFKDPVVTNINTLSKYLGLTKSITAYLFDPETYVQHTTGCIAYRLRQYCEEKS